MQTFAPTLIPDGIFLSNCGNLIENYELKSDIECKRETSRSIAGQRSYRESINDVPRFLVIFDFPTYLVLIHNVRFGGLFWTPYLPQYRTSLMDVPLQKEISINRQSVTLKFEPFGFEKLPMAKYFLAASDMLNQFSNWLFSI